MLLTPWTLWPGRVYGWLPPWELEEVMWSLTTACLGH